MRGVAGGSVESAQVGSASPTMLGIGGRVREDRAWRSGERSEEE